MKTALRCVVLLLVVALTAAPAWAAELRMTGYVDSVFPNFRSNVSGPDSDQDLSRNHDQSFFGRTRGRIFFNAIASDDLRGVFGFELDAFWGLNPEGEQGSFQRNTDLNGNIETKWLYVDFRVPQLPIGNRVRLGGLPIYATPLHGATVLHGDHGGGEALFNFTEQVTLHTYYVQFEENSDPGTDSFPGSPARLGEDYATGATLRLKPLTGLDLHLVGLYGHLHLPSPSLTSNTSNSAPFGAIFNDPTNVATESRYYLGFDSRYRLGNFSLEPTFFYLMGSRNFCSPGSTIGSVACTSPVGSPKDTDYNAFVGQFLVSHTRGPWLMQARYVYASGNKANDDINNRGIGKRSDVKSFLAMNVDGGPMWMEWFEIMGSSEVDGTSIDTFRRQFEAGHLERYGWQSLAGAVEYKATDNLILEGAAGGFWSAQKTGCPAVLRQGTIDGACGGPETVPEGDPVLNFTGNSRYLGFEIAAGIRYSIMPGLTWTPRLAYADYGKGLDQNGRKAMDAWLFTNRMIYIF